MINKEQTNDLSKTIQLLSEAHVWKHKNQHLTSVLNNLLKGKICCEEGDWSSIINAEQNEVLKNENNMNNLHKDVKMTREEEKSLYAMMFESSSCCKECIYLFDTWKLSYASSIELLSDVEKERMVKALLNDKSLNATVDIFQNNWKILRHDEIRELWFKNMEKQILGKYALSKCTFSMIILFFFEFETFRFFVKTILSLYEENVLYLHTGYDEWEFICDFYRNKYRKNMYPEIDDEKILRALFIYLCIDGVFFDDSINEILQFHIEIPSGKRVEFLLLKVLYVIYHKTKRVDCRFKQLLLNILHSDHTTKITTKESFELKNNFIMYTQDIYFIIDSFPIFIDLKIEEAYFTLLSNLKAGLIRTEYFKVLLTNSSRICVRDFINNFSFFNEFVFLCLTNETFSIYQSYNAKSLIKRLLELMIHEFYRFDKSHDNDLAYNLLYKWNTIFIEIIKHIKNNDDAQSLFLHDTIILLEFFFFDISKNVCLSKPKLSDIYKTFKNNARTVFKAKWNHYILDDNHKVYFNVLIRRREVLEFLNVKPSLINRIVLFYSKYNIVIPDINILFDILGNYHFDEFLFLALVELLGLQSLHDDIIRLLDSMVKKIDRCIEPNTLQIIHKKLSEYNGQKIDEIVLSLKQDVIKYSPTEYEPYIHKSKRNSPKPEENIYPTSKRTCVEDKYTIENRVLEKNISVEERFLAEEEDGLLEREIDSDEKVGSSSIEEHQSSEGMEYSNDSLCDSELDLIIRKDEELTIKEHVNIDNLVEFNTSNRSLINDSITLDSKKTKDGDKKAVISQEINLHNTLDNPIKTLIQENDDKSPNKSLKATIRRTAEKTQPVMDIQIDQLQTNYEIPGIISAKSPSINSNSFAVSGSKILSSETKGDLKDNLTKLISFKSNTTPNLNKDIRLINNSYNKESYKAPQKKNNKTKTPGNTFNAVHSLNKNTMLSGALNNKTRSLTGKYMKPIPNQFNKPSGRKATEYKTPNGNFDPYQFLDQNLLPPIAKKVVDDIDIEVDFIYQQLLAKAAMINNLNAQKISFLKISDYINFFTPLVINEIKTNIKKDTPHTRPYTSTDLSFVSMIDRGSNLKDMFLSSRSVVNYIENDYIEFRINASSGRHVFYGIYKEFTSQRNACIIKIIVNDNSFTFNHGEAVSHRLVSSLNTYFREYNSLFNLDHFQLKNIILTPSQITQTRPTEENIDDFMNTFNVNIHQATVLAAVALPSNKLTLVQGPPGSGKTTLIVSLIKAFHSERIRLDRIDGKSRILICAPSNTAIDEVSRRLMSGIILANGELFKPFVIRIGIGSSLCDVTKEISLEYLTEQFNSLNTTQRNLRKIDLLMKSDIICSTLSSSVHESLFLTKLNLDFLIIDESCQSVEPSTIIPLKHNPRKIVLIGDPKQLPPTIINPSPFYEFSLFQRLSKFCEPLMLKTQYRMSKEIALLPSRLFYNSQLETDLSCLERNNPFDGILDPLTFVNVNGKEAIADNTGYINQVEAVQIVMFLNHIGAGIEEGNLAIITPYKAQVHLLTQLIQKVNPYIADKIDINTVDAFQGQEKDIVIISVVRSDKIGFINDERRLNVALTRAKFACVIFGNTSFLRTNDLWQKIINFCRSKKYLYENSVFFERFEDK